MDLKTFLEQLMSASEKELIFQFDDKEIRKDYHITEMLRNSVTAIDCGGKMDQWEETVIQLVEPSGLDGERFMSSSKALSILSQSLQKIDFDQNSKIILEFKPQSSTAAQRYNLGDIYGEGNKLIVVSQGATTQCKAAIRSNPEGIDNCGAPKTSAASTCCAPAEKVKVSKATCCG
jgi:hypothetical protein